MFAPSRFESLRALTKSPTERSRDEVESVRKERDCIDAVKNKLLDNNWATAADIKQIEKDVRKQVDNEVKFAKPIDFLASVRFEVLQRIEDDYDLRFRAYYDS